MGAPTIRTNRPRALVAGIALVVPLLATLIAVMLLSVWRDELPDRVATHWGTGGVPDGFTSVSALLWTLIAVGVGLMAVAVVTAVVSDERVVCAYVISGAAGMAAFIVTLALVSTGIQRGLTDAAAVRLPGWWFLVAAAVGAACAALVYRLVPQWAGPAERVAATTPMTLVPTERVVWTRSVLSAGIALALLVFGVLSCAAAAMLTAQWFLLGVAVAIAVVAVVMYGIRVTVDPAGLSIRSAVGWPRTLISIADIAAVRVVRVSALKDFGGYGYRVGFRGELKGARGFVLKSGDGILVDRIGGGRQIVVVDDADTAVALLEAYRLRVRDPA